MTSRLHSNSLLTAVTPSPYDNPHPARQESTTKTIGVNYFADRTKLISTEYFTFTLSRKTGIE